jgi:homoserine O-acetyltransferase
MDAIVAVLTAPMACRNVEQSLDDLRTRLATDPEWNGGWYYDSGGAMTALTELRVETLKRYAIEAAFADRYPDPEAREAAIRQLAADWTKCFDGNSMIILRCATIGYDTVKDFRKIRAKILYVLCRTDRLFPPDLAPGAMNALAAAGVDARYFEIDSELGHSASGPEHAKWSPVLRELLEPLIADSISAPGSTRR